MTVVFVLCVFQELASILKELRRVQKQLEGRRAEVHRRTLTAAREADVCWLDQPPARKLC